MPPDDVPWPAKPRLIGTAVPDGERLVRRIDARPETVHAAVVVCPLARARVTAIDDAKAKRMPGVRAVVALVKPGDEVFFAGAPVAAVAADSPAEADAAARAVRVAFERLPWTVREEEALKADGRTAAPIGTASDRSNRRTVAPVVGRGFDEAIKRAEVTSVSDVRVAAALTDGHDTELAKVLKRPVRVARTRVSPGLSATVRVSGKKDGTLLALDADVVQGDGPTLLLSGPYEAARRVAPVLLRLNRDEEPANASLGAVAVECAIDDFAAAAGVDPLEVRRKSVPAKSPAALVLEELAKRAWRGWHPPGKTAGPMRRGLGMALADWPVSGTGRATAAVTVYPDGSVTVDAPPGPAIPFAVLTAEALGIEPAAVEVRETRAASHPDAAARAVWSAAVAARAALLKAAGRAGPWRALCTALGKTPVLGEAMDAGADVRSAVGAFAAEVTVDDETGVVSVQRFVAVQDAGRVIERLTTVAEIEAGVTAGVARALCREAAFDRHTGRAVGPPGRLRLADCPRLDVHLVSLAPAVVRLGGASVGAMAAVANAVFNALGKRPTGLPLTPECVKEV